MNQSHHSEQTWNQTRVNLKFRRRKEEMDRLEVTYGPSRGNSVFPGLEVVGASVSWEGWPLPGSGCCKLSNRPKGARCQRSGVLTVLRGSHHWNQPLVSTHRVSLFRTLPHLSAFVLYSDPSDGSWRSLWFLQVPKLQWLSVQTFPSLPLCSPAWPHRLSKCWDSEKCLKKGSF